jgi:hypothetical protein
VGWYVGSGIAVAAAGVLLLGIYPQPLIETVRFSAQFLP